VIGYTSWETAFMKAIGAGVVKDRFVSTTPIQGWVDLPVHIEKIRKVSNQWLYPYNHVSCSTLLLDPGSAVFALQPDL